MMGEMCVGRGVTSRVGGLSTVFCYAIAPFGFSAPQSRLTNEEVEVSDEGVLPHQRGGEPQLAVRLDDAQHLAEHGGGHHVHLRGMMCG